MIDLTNEIEKRVRLDAAEIRIARIEGVLGLEPPLTTRDPLASMNTILDEMEARIARLEEAQRRLAPAQGLREPDGR